MSGTLQVESGEFWGVAGWVFYDVLEILADELSGSSVVPRMREVIDNNLGWFSIKDLPPGERGPVRNAILLALPDRWDKLLPQDLPSRDAVLERVTDLVRIASHPPTDDVGR